MNSTLLILRFPNGLENKIQNSMLSHPEVYAVKF
jgi:hypothetical protein